MELWYQLKKAIHRGSTTKVNDHTFIEGYWGQSYFNSEYPWPIIELKRPNEGFMNKLSELMSVPFKDLIMSLSFQ